MEILEPMRPVSLRHKGKGRERPSSQRDQRESVLTRPGEKKKGLSFSSRSGRDSRRFEWAPPFSLGAAVWEGKVASSSSPYIGGKLKRGEGGRRASLIILKKCRGERKGNIKWRMEDVDELSFPPTLGVGREEKRGREGGDPLFLLLHARTGKGGEEFPPVGGEGGNSKGYTIPFLPGGRVKGEKKEGKGLPSFFRSRDRGRREVSFFFFFSLGGGRGGQKEKRKKETVNPDLLAWKVTGGKTGRSRRHFLKEGEERKKKRKKNIEKDSIPHPGGRNEQKKEKGGKATGSHKEKRKEEGRKREEWRKGRKG